MKPCYIKSYYDKKNAYIRFLQFVLTNLVIPLLAFQYSFKTTQHPPLPGRMINYLVVNRTIFLILNILRGVYKGIQQIDKSPMTPFQISLCQKNLGMMPRTIPMTETRQMTTEAMRKMIMKKEIDVLRDTASFDKRTSEGFSFEKAFKKLKWIESCYQTWNKIS